MTAEIRKSAIEAIIFICLYKKNATEVHIVKVPILYLNQNFFLYMKQEI